jgi:hypothetical protein
MLQLYFLWFVVGVFCAAVLIFNGQWQPATKKFFLTTSAKVRELVQRENTPKFYIDRRVAQWTCHFFAVTLILLGITQFVVFYGSFKAPLYPIPYFLFAYILSSYDAENFQKEAENAERSYHAEKKIVGFLEPFLAQGGTLKNLCRQEGERREDLDVFLSMPSGNSFVVSVKNFNNEAERIKVWFDSKRGRLRYRRGQRGIKDFRKEPTIDLQEQVGRFLSDGLIPSCRVLHLILVFPSRIELSVHEATPVEEVGGHRFVKLNGVYLVLDEYLPPLINALHCA